MTSTIDDRRTQRAAQRASRWGVPQGGSAGVDGSTAEIVVLRLVDDRLVVDVGDDEAAPSPAGAGAAHRTRTERRARPRVRLLTADDILVAPYPLAEAYMHPAPDAVQEVPDVDDRDQLEVADVAEVAELTESAGSASDMSNGVPRVIASGRARSAGPIARAERDTPPTEGRAARMTRPNAVDPRIGARREEVTVSRRRTRNRRIAVVIVAVLAGAGGVAGVLASPLLKVRTVRVSGAADIGTDRVRAAAGLPSGTSMFDVDLAEIGRTVGELALVEDVVVERSWPSTVTIRVTEAIPVATMPADSLSASSTASSADTVSEWLLLDRRGKVLERRAARPSLPLVELATGEASPGDTHLRGALRVASALTADLRQQVRRITVRGTEINLWMTRPDAPAVKRGPADELLVLVGEPDDLDAKVRAFDAMLSGATLSNAAVLDLTVPDQPIVTPRIG